VIPGWERLGEGVFRCRLPFLDVTVGLVLGSAGALLVDTGTTLAEAQAVERAVWRLASRSVTHIVLTHNHFDHVLGSAAFRRAAVYCAPEVAETLRTDTQGLRADALRHGAAADEVDRAIAALQAPQQVIRDGSVDLGHRTVSISHPGAGHTNHDLIVVVPGRRRIVFCGDLVEESGDPVIDAESHVAAWPVTLDRVLAAGGDDALFVPGHGAVVDAAFVRTQQRWLAEQL
jgi:glyoxylase-like metal-dependent hydrolase (beta-lactamase superfamily II)